MEEASLYLFNFKLIRQEQHVLALWFSTYPEINIHLPGFAQSFKAGFLFFFCSRKKTHKSAFLLYVKYAKVVYFMTNNFRGGDWFLYS